jgi:hypothetical protein
MKRDLKRSELKKLDLPKSMARARNSRPEYLSSKLNKERTMPVSYLKLTLLHQASVIKRNRMVK